MEKSTQELIKKISKYTFFENTGVNSSDTIKNWDIAIKSSVDIEYENIKIEEASNISEALFYKDKDRFQTWNDTVEELKKDIKIVCNTAVKKIDLKKFDKKTLLDVLSWDLLHICLLNEFQKYYHSILYMEIDKVYKRGHFPCNWNGLYPDGNILFY